MRALVRTLLVTLSALLAVAVWVPGASAAPTGGSTPAGVPAVGRSSVGPRSYLVTTPLEGRTARTLANHAVADRYPAGSSVLVLCQSSGGPTYHGSRIWDLTSDGLWVPDAFVATGTDGYAADLPPAPSPGPTSRLGHSTGGRRSG